MVEEYSRGVVTETLKVGTQDAAQRSREVWDENGRGTGKSSFRANNQNQAANICKTQHIW